MVFFVALPKPSTWTISFWIKFELFITKKTQANNPSIDWLIANLINHIWPLLN